MAASARAAQSTEKGRYMVQRVRGEIEIVTLSLGDCECPGFPHGKYDPEKKTGGDFCQYKDRLDYGDWRRVNAQTDEAKQATLFVRSIVGWNIADASGETLDLTINSLDNLSLIQSGILMRTLDTFQYTLGQLGVTLPNLPAGDGKSPAPETKIDDASAVGPEGTSS